MLPSPFSVKMEKLKELYRKNCLFTETKAFNIICFLNKLKFQHKICLSKKMKMSQEVYLAFHLKLSSYALTPK